METNDNKTQVVKVELNRISDKTTERLHYNTQISNESVIQNGSGLNQTKSYLHPADRFITSVHHCQNILVIK